MPAYQSKIITTSVGLPKKAPITFTKYQQEFIGLIKVGFLKGYFGIDFKPYKGATPRGNAQKSSRQKDIVKALYKRGKGIKKAIRVKWQNEIREP